MLKLSRSFFQLFFKAQNWETTPKLNVRSIHYKINNLQTLLLMDDWDIIVLTENGSMKILVIGSSNSMDTAFFVVTDVVAAAF